jgi:hypothetical protein
MESVIEAGCDGRRPGDYDGGVETYKHNTSDTYPKDPVISKYIPDKISHCALHLGKDRDEPCASAPVVAEIGRIVGVGGAPAEIVHAAAVKLRCKTDDEGEKEICVLQKLEDRLGPQRVRGEIALNHKIEGPTDGKLLSNVNLDDQLAQWMMVFPEFFGYNFNMLNYADYKFRGGRVINAPDTLATVQFADLVAGGADTSDVPGMVRRGGSNRYKCAGCVINKDVYQGAGTHWMALFADTRGDTYTVEFFNSSGNAPNAEWVNWLVKTRAGIEALIERGVLAPKPVKIVKASSLRHQKSKSECGVYALFYIWARLNGTPIAYFQTRPIPDQHMFEFRQHLFRDPRRKAIREFVWDQYMNTVDIKWE